MSVTFPCLPPHTMSGRSKNATSEAFRPKRSGDLRRFCQATLQPYGVLFADEFDGALGFWSAVREVFPETRERRCWWHKISNVLNALPKSAQPGAKKALAEIWNAEDKDHAQAAASVFAADYGTKWPKASSSNDPTDQRVVISKSRDKPILSPIAPCPPPSRVPSPGYAFPQPLTKVTIVI